MQLEFTGEVVKVKRYGWCKVYIRNGFSIPLYMRSDGRTFHVSAEQLRTKKPESSLMEVKQSSFDTSINEHKMEAMKQRKNLLMQKYGKAYVHAPRKVFQEVCKFGPCCTTRNCDRVHKFPSGEPGKYCVFALQNECKSQKGKCRWRHPDEDNLVFDIKRKKWCSSTK